MQVSHHNLETQLQDAHRAGADSALRTEEAQLAVQQLRQELAAIAQRNAERCDELRSEADTHLVSLQHAHSGRDVLHAELQEYQALRREWEERHHSSSRDSSENVSSLQVELNEQTTRNEEMQVSHHNLETQLQDAHRAGADSALRTEEAQLAVQQLRQELAAIAQRNAERCDELRSETDTHLASLQQAHSGRDVLHAELQEYQALRRECEERHQSVRRHGAAELVVLHCELDERRTLHEQLQDRHCDLESDLQDAHRAHSDIASRAEETELAFQHLRQELAAIGDQSTQRCEELRSEADSQLASLQRAHAGRDSLHVELQLCQALCQELEEKLAFSDRDGAAERAALQAELDEGRSLHKQLQGERSDLQAQLQEAHRAGADTASQAKEKELALQQLRQDFTIAETKARRCEELGSEADAHLASLQRAHTELQEFQNLCREWEERYHFASSNNADEIAALQTELQEQLRLQTQIQGGHCGLEDQLKVAIQEHRIASARESKLDEIQHQLRQDLDEQQLFAKRQSQLRLPPPVASSAGRAPGFIDSKAAMTNAAAASLKASSQSARGSRRDGANTCSLDKCQPDELVLDILASVHFAPRSSGPQRNGEHREFCARDDHQVGRAMTPSTWSSTPLMSPEALHTTRSSDFMQETLSATASTSVGGCHAGPESDDDEDAPTFGSRLPTGDSMGGYSSAPSATSTRVEEDEEEEEATWPDFAFAQLEQIHAEGWQSMSWKDNYTLLHWAGKHNRPHLCVRLMWHGADPDVKDSIGKSAMDYAVESGALEAAAQLRGGRARRGGRGSHSEDASRSLRGGSLDGSFGSLAARSEGFA